MGQDRRNKRNGLRLAAWAAALAPASVLLHELGHWSAGRLLGYRPVLNVASVSGGAEPGTAPAWEVAVQAGAGPAVTMLLTVAAIATARRGGSRSAAFALAAVAPVRMLMAPIGLLTWSLAALDLVRAGRPNFDEYNFAIAVGAPTPAILLPSSLFLGWAWLRVWRQLPSPRPVHILWLVTGMVAGLAGWVKLVGPVAVALIR